MDSDDYPIPCNSMDEDRWTNPAERLYERKEYDARLGEMSGKPKLVDGYTRKTSGEQLKRRPLIDRLPGDLAEPSLNEGVEFVQRMANKDDFEY